MLPSSEEDLGGFVDGLKRESDSSLPFVATALIEDRLLETLRAFLCSGPAASRLLDIDDAPLTSAAARAETCFALGLIDEHEYQEIALLRKVRDIFASDREGISFQTPEVESYCLSLKSGLSEESSHLIDDARFRYTNAAGAIGLRLYDRPVLVAQERRQAKSWVPLNPGKRRFFGGTIPAWPFYILIGAILYYVWTCVF